MGNRVEPDTDDVMDLAIFRRDIEDRLRADGMLCVYDQHALAEFDAAFGRLSGRIRVRQAFDRVLKSGLTRYTRDGAKEVGLALVMSTENSAGPVADVVAWPCPESQAA